MKCLLEAGANPGIMDINGCLPAHYSLINGDLIGLKLLPFLKNEPFLVSANNYLPTTFVIEAGDLQILKYLLENIDPVGTVDNGFSLLHTAVQHGKLNIVKYLNENFPELNLYQDRNGLTPLHLAISKGKSKIAMFLKNESTDNEIFNIKDHYGKTVLDYARKSWNQEIKNLFK